MLKDYRWISAASLGAALMLSLAGCTGTLKLPINAYSHVRLEASPLSNEFQVSYHLYDALPASAKAPHWSGKIKIDGLGTVYDSKETGSPAAKRLEDGWERLWVDGNPNWGTIERMVLDSQADQAPAQRTTSARRRSQPSHAPPRSHVMQLDELPPLLFSSAPQW